MQIGNNIQTSQTPSSIFYHSFSTIWTNIRETSKKQNDHETSAHHYSSITWPFLWIQGSLESVKQDLHKSWHGFKKWEHWFLTNNEVQSWNRCCLVFLAWNRWALSFPMMDDDGGMAQDILEVLRSWTVMADALQKTNPARCCYRWRMLMKTDSKWWIDVVLSKAGFCSLRVSWLVLKNAKDVVFWEWEHNGFCWLVAAFSGFKMMLG